MAMDNRRPRQQTSRRLPAADDLLHSSHRSSPDPLQSDGHEEAFSTDVRMPSDRDTWEALARTVPHWAACTGGRGPKCLSPDQFFKSGAIEVTWALDTMLRIDPNYHPAGTALVFGCGPGRQLAPLSQHFARIIAVDISPTMLKLARDSSPSLQVEYQERIDDLPANSISLVYCVLVLQHLSRDQMLRILSEFYRVMCPGTGNPPAPRASAGNSGRPFVPTAASLVPSVRPDALPGIPLGRGYVLVQDRLGTRVPPPYRIRSSRNYIWPGIQQELERSMVLRMEA
jgi:SAM-dependent methyltransferase